MNIIKFKDILLDSSTGLSEDKIQLFNKSLKGKYAYAVNWIYILPLESISQEEYIELSRGSFLTEGTYIELEHIQSYVDLEETANINNVDKYKVQNKYTTDSNITLDEIKNFRTWLAFSLLQQSIQDQDVKHMLEYYNFDDPENKVGPGMYDEVIKSLSTFGRTDIIFDSTTSTCGCGGLTSFNTTTTQIYGITTNKKSYCDCANLSSSLSYTSAVNLCNPVEIYRKNIYVKMVDTFKEVDFWVPFKDTLLVDMVNYIKNIINTNLPLYTTKYVSNYTDCGCLSEKDLEQKTNIQILKNLEKSLTYIINDDLDGHKNFISDSLSTWSSLLYERMYWG